ncbi:MAG: STAS domain-containing protein [Synergistaceae bacterium]|jgi:anti-anti-sigma factor|nr:STAS domain-containing protein [Synergistaceae bacterium]
MEINVNRDGDVIAVALAGKLDTATAPSLQRAMEEILSGGGAMNVSVDFSAIEFVSSAGLRVLLLSMKKIAAVKGSLVLKNMRDPVKEVFDMTGFSAILKIV